MSFYVLLSVTMALLATDPHFAKRGFTIKVILLICYSIDFAGVAGKAPVKNNAFKSLVIGWKITGRQVP